MLLTNPIVTHIEGFYSTFRIPPLPWRGGTGTHFRNSKWKAVLSFGPFFLDFCTNPDFFREIGPEMVRICIKSLYFTKNELIKN